MTIAEEQAARAAAASFVLEFGKYKGRNLANIAACDDDGARYLDWLVGVENESPYIDPKVFPVLKTFLAIPWVAKLVDESKSRTSYSEPISNAKEPRKWWEK